MWMDLHAEPIVRDPFVLTAKGGGGTADAGSRLGTDSIELC